MGDFNIRGRGLVPNGGSTFSAALLALISPYLEVLGNFDPARTDPIRV